MSVNPVGAFDLPPQNQNRPQRDDTVRLSPNQGDLLSLPFDQYGRMRVVQDLAVTLYAEIARQAAQSQDGTFTLQVLDVGGYPGVLPRFLAGEAYDVTVLDVVPDDGTIPGYKQGSGLDLPFADASFDLVTGLDTLEHIPAGHRAGFLGEIMRVARYAVVLVNPVQSLEADLAEETLDEYIRWVLDAQQEQLAEHRQYGLPDFDATVDAFRNNGWQTAHFPIANVYNWLFMMVAKHYLISLHDDHASSFERTLDRFYNLTFLDSDRTQPAYRGVMVAVRPGLEDALSRVEEQYSPIISTEQSNLERLQLTQLLMGMLDMKVANHEDRRLREQIEARDQHIAGLQSKITLLENELKRVIGHSHELESTIRQVQVSDEAEFAKHKTYISRLEEEQRSKNEHILYLERLLQGIEAGRVMRLTRAFSRFLGR